jgi:hypothetical protein
MEMEKPTPILVTFDGRHTGMGAYTRFHVFSLRKRVEIAPHRTESSRTGNHWTDFWWLLPGKYFVCWRDISNTGKHRCGYGCLIVGSPFVQLQNGEVKLFREVRTEDYGTWIIGDNERFHHTEVLRYSTKNFGVSKWIGDVPEFARDALCECLMPRDVSE